MHTPEASKPGAPRPTALVVDRDATSRRFAEIALGRVGFVVETAQDAAGALDTLKLEVVDLIVCDTDLDDMDGLTFFRRLANEHRLRSIPFMFLSADPAASVKVSALRAGADDYLVKPCEVSEFVARAEALVERQRRMRDTLRARTYSLAGELSVVPFADVIALLELTRRSGVLSIFTQGTSGLLYFENGRVVHAQCANLVGEPAFFQLFGERSGHFEFTLASTPPTSCTIQSSTSAMILEAARLSDVEAINRPTEAEWPTQDLETPPRLVNRPALVPPLSPDHGARLRFESAMEDKFALGDICLWSDQALAEWTRSDVGEERFHVHLVADLSSGISSMLALAGSPSEDMILESLSEGRKSFGLKFFLRRDRVLDVLLIDAKDPTAHLPWMQRVPSLMLICPPDGGLLGLGSSARVGLEQFIETLAPPVVVGVGNDALSTGLAQLRPFHEGSLLHCVHTDPGDLRSLMVEGIGFWSNSIPQ